MLWIGFISLTPPLGALLYFLFGVNRIRRGEISPQYRAQRDYFQSEPDFQKRIERLLPIEGAHLTPLVHLGDKITGKTLEYENQIQLLIDGDEAYPAMLEAIRTAQKFIRLSTYIFGNDSVGKMFIDELSNAVQRGIDVRVLIDAAGARYSWPTVVPSLKRARIPVARFTSHTPLGAFLSLNLRNHRKIMVADGKVGFTGGINIRAQHLLHSSHQVSKPVQDLHFRLSGPIVAVMQNAFDEDWYFSTGQMDQKESSTPKHELRGTAIVRGILDGPDEHFEALRLVLLGALSCAKTSVKILTPYFLPDQSLISALNIAALRGVQVDIILPEKSNLPFVQWASMAQWRQLLGRGCRIWLTPPPFDHSKVMLVDGCWALIGSANWDPRSLRLNFEFNVECYDRAFAVALEQLIRRKLNHARPINLQDMDNRKFPIKLRDGVALLFTPFL